MNRDETLELIDIVIKEECSILKKLITENCTETNEDDEDLRQQIRKYRAALKYVKDNLQ